MPACPLQCDNWPLDTLQAAYNYIEHIVNDHTGDEA